jgi:hypothetical protein
MRGLRTYLLLAGATTTALGIAIASAQQQPAGNGVYTAEQANIADAYQTTCAAAMPRLAAARSPPSRRKFH